MYFFEEIWLQLKKLEILKIFYDEFFPLIFFIISFLIVISDRYIFLHNK